MSGTETGAVAGGPQIGAITNDTKKKGETPLGLFGKIKAYILAHKSGVSNLLQITGAAGLALGGAALLFAGVAGILTVAGTPLGVPLLIAGGILFGVGTILKIAEKVEKTGLTAGQKIKEFFKDTLINITKGTILAGAFLGLCKVVPLSTLIVIAPIAIKLIPYLKEDLNDKDQWRKFVETFPKDSTIRKALEEGRPETFDDFLEQKFGVLKAVKGVVERLDEKPETKEENASEKGKAKSPKTNTSGKGEDPKDTLLNDAVTNAMGANAA